MEEFGAACVQLQLVAGHGAVAGIRRTLSNRINLHDFQIFAYTCKRKVRKTLICKRLALKTGRPFMHGFSQYRAHEVAHGATFEIVTN